MDPLTKTAVQATLHCLTGCAIGEVLGMIIGTALGWHGVATIALAIFLAFVFGYALSMLPLVRSGLPLAKALKIALAADTISILTMEITDNAFMLAVPGAMEAGLNSWLFWGALTLSLVVAFFVTVPVNRWLIARGKGHAIAHQYHHNHRDHEAMNGSDHTEHTHHHDSHNGHDDHDQHNNHAN